jgi:hypothetical protein
MKNEPRLIDYLGKIPMFENRWGTILVPREVYKGNDFNLSCLFETWRRLQFLPIQSEYSAQFDGMKWWGMSPYFVKIPIYQVATEYEIMWENAIDIDDIISIECYYRNTTFPVESEWILLPNN